MRVFVTGATGFVGTAVVQELLKAGHHVSGLARSDAAAAALEKAGVAAHRGHLEDLDSLSRGAEAAEAVIHTGFIHDFSKYKENCEIDRRAILALGEVLSGSDRPLIVTSGTAVLNPGNITTEDDRPKFGDHGTPRVSEQAAQIAAAKGTRTAIVRLPPSVHGDGDHGFVPILIGIARKTGASAYVGEGLNRWPAVHRLDAGALYRLVLEKGVSGGHYHATAEDGVPFRQIAEVIGRRLNLPVVGKNQTEAAEHFGWFAHFAGIDSPASSEKTRQDLGWQPNGIGLIADIDRASYFEG